MLRDVMLSFLLQWPALPVVITEENLAFSRTESLLLIHNMHVLGQSILSNSVASCRKTTDSFLEL